MRVIIGIDLGTTNSLVAVWREGVQLVPNALGEVLTPSVPSLDRTSEIVIGGACEHQSAHSELAETPQWPRGEG